MKNAKRYSDAGHNAVVKEDYLDKYATALEGVGSQTKAVEFRKQANAIRQRNLDVKSLADRTPYGKHCAQQ